MMARRKFSKEFKVAAIRRLQGGQTAAEVARGLEVHPSELHRWRHELDEHGERAFQGSARSVPKRAGWPTWSAKSVSRPWRSIF